MHDLGQLRSNNTASCKKAAHLITVICADALLADKSYDSSAIIAMAIDAGMKPVIPP